LQRPALLLVNSAVYVAFGSNGCDQYEYHGWLMGYDAQSLQQTFAFNTTPNDKHGAIWQSGGGPAADDQGNIYLQTGNGIFDADIGLADYGHSILKIGPGVGGLEVLDYFTPFNQEFLRANDLDLGSGAAVLLPDQPGDHPHELVGGGK